MLALKKTRLPTVSVENFVDNTMKLPSKPEEFKHPATLATFCPMQIVEQFQSYANFSDYLR